MQLIIIMGFLVPEVDIDGIKEVFVDYNEFYEL